MPKHQSPSLPHQLPIPVEMIERRIYLICGHKVMLDAEFSFVHELDFTCRSEIATRANRDLRRMRRMA
jgi:hypothetical protein